MALWRKALLEGRNSWISRNSNIREVLLSLNLQVDRFTVGMNVLEVSGETISGTLVHCPYWIYWQRKVMIHLDNLAHLAVAQPSGKERIQEELRNQH